MTKYHILTTRVEGESGLSGTVVDLPGVITQGETVEELKKNVQEAIQLFLESRESMEIDMPRVQDPQIIDVVI